MKNKSATLDEVKAAVIQVYQDYNGNIPVIFKVRETPEQLYGKENIEQNPDLKQAAGAYLPRGDHRGGNGGQSFIYLGSSLIRYDDRAKEGNGEINSESQGYREALKVVRHEVLGHYALNTLTKEDKLNVLTTIIQNKDEPTLKGVWNDVEKLYPKGSKLQQAEEVYSFTAENKVQIDPKYKRTNKTFSISDLEQLSAAVGEGIKNGQRTQQIFPKNNGEQFRKQKESFLETSYKWSAIDNKMHLKINGQSPNALDRDLLNKIIIQDKFLKDYSLENVQNGMLDLKLAKTQPVPKKYDMQGLQHQENVSSQMSIANQ